jgi:ABC-type transport system substrate-binding protein
MADFIGWTERILKELKLEDWKIEYTPKDFVDGITLFDSKVIRLTFPEPSPDFALILHEICHAWTGHKHDSTFSYAFTELVRQYMAPKTF